MDFDDIEISYIGEEEAFDDADNNEDLNEDYEPRSIRVNSNGKSEERISIGQRRLILIVRSNIRTQI